MKAKGLSGPKHEHTCSTQFCHRSAEWTPRLPCPAAGTVTTEVGLLPPICMRSIYIAERGHGTLIWEERLELGSQRHCQTGTSTAARGSGRPGAYKGMGKGQVAQGRSSFWEAAKLQLESSCQRSSLHRKSAARVQRALRPSQWQKGGASTLGL